MVEIQESELTEKVEIYRDPTGKTFIFFAKWRDPRQPGNEELVAVKEILTQGMIEPYTYIEECMNQIRIVSPNICKIHGWCISPQKVTIVMERLDNDLSKEIEEKRKSGDRFTEQELFDILWQVGSVFAKMQGMNVSHNDIKAENIFLKKKEGLYKVGDFGSASVHRCLEHSLTGTPLYLSPILKYEYEHFNRTRQKREIKHNPFKSDVFSLGVTMIFAANLYPPTDLQEFANLDYKLQQHINYIKQTYAYLGECLTHMLAIDETNRWDFLDLKRQLNISQTVAEQRDDQQMSSLRPQETSATEEMIQDLNKSYESGNERSIATLLKMFSTERNGLTELEAVIEGTCIQCLTDKQIGEFCSVCKCPLG